MAEAAYNGAMNKCLFVKRLMILGLLLSPTSLFANSIFHWVDENGVHHYTESPPPSDIRDVSQVAIEDTRSSDYEPGQDIYNVAEQQERMLAIREERAEKREKYREAQERQARQRPVVVVQQTGYPYATSGWWNRPGKPPPWRPPLKPVHPIAPPVVEPDPPSFPFRPPGRR